MIPQCHRCNKPDHSPERSMLTLQDDYQYCNQCVKAIVEELNQWKADARVVMTGWQEVHEALGKPGLGQMRFVSSLAEVKRMVKRCESYGNETQELKRKLNKAKMFIALVATHNNEHAEHLRLKASSLMRELEP